MKKRWMALVVLAAALICLPPILYMSYYLPKKIYPPPLSPQIDFDCQVFRLEGGAHGSGGIENDIWSAKKKSKWFGGPGGECIFFTSYHYEMGSNRLELGQKKCLWNGDEIKLYDHDLTSRTLLADGNNQAFLLAGPHFYFDFGTQKSFRVEYNPMPDASKPYKEPTGFDVKLSATRMPDGRIRVPMQIDWTAVEKRGSQKWGSRPTLQQYQYETELLWRSDRDEMGCIISGGELGTLLFWFRLAPLVRGNGSI
jgi:hypothetical protein